MNDWNEINGQPAPTANPNINLGPFTLPTAVATATITTASDQYFSFSEISFGQLQTAADVTPPQYFFYPIA